jgi:hypothetical protein
MLATDTTSAVDAFSKTMYGLRGLNPPTVYAPAIVKTLSNARFGAGCLRPLAQGVNNRSAFVLGYAVGPEHLGDFRNLGPCRTFLRSTAFFRA